MRRLHIVHYFFCFTVAICALSACQTGAAILANDESSSSLGATSGSDTTTSAGLPSNSTGLETGNGDASGEQGPEATKSNTGPGGGPTGGLPGTSSSTKTGSGATQTNGDSPDPNAPRCPLTKIDDNNLRRLITEAIGPSARQKGFDSLRNLDISNPNPNPKPEDIVRSLAGLECAKNLQILRIRNQHVESFTPIGDPENTDKLTRLKELDVRGNPGSTDELNNIDISALKTLESLKWSISEIESESEAFASLSGKLESVKKLGLEGRGVTNLVVHNLLSDHVITGLEVNAAPNFEVTAFGDFCDNGGSPETSHCKEITHLDLSHMGMRTLDWMATASSSPVLASLYHLRINSNKIRDLSPLAAYDQRSNSSIYLFAANNLIESVKPIAPLRLSELELNGNRNIKDLDELNKSSQLAVLRVNDCNIQELPKLDNLKKLKEYQVSRNPISSIAQVSNLSSLTFLALRKTKVDDLKPVAALTALTRIVLAETKTIKTLEGLENLPSLANVEASYSGVTDVSAVLKWVKNSEKPGNGFKPPIHLDVNGCPEELLCNNPSFIELRSLANSSNPPVKLRTTCPNSDAQVSSGAMTPSSSLLKNLP